MASGVDPQVTVELWYLFVRACVLIIASLGGCLCIFLGWKLYADGVASRFSGEMSWKGVTLRLAAAGPGIAFAGFGMWLLVYLSDRTLKTDTQSLEIESEAVVPAQPAPAALTALLAYQAKPAPPPVAARQVVCFRRTRRELLDGDLSPERVREALRTAVAAMEKRRGKASGAQAARLNDSIDILTEMGGSVESWSTER